MPSRSLPPLIAIVGCDGSGKSARTEVLQARLTEGSAYRRLPSGHAEPQCGSSSDAATRLERAIHKKAKAAQPEQGTSLMTAIGIYAFTLRRERRFQRMMKLRRAGNLIIADCFPRLEIQGPTYAPRLGNAGPTGLVGWLVRRERQKFAAMVTHRPDFVIRLNVSLNVVHARKPDQPSASLARKIADLSHLVFQGAPIIEVDADEPLEVVQANAKAAIADLLRAEHGIIIPTPKVSQ